MIIFYPRDIGRWRNDFDFSCRTGAITLECKSKTDNKRFHNRNEFIDYLKEQGVRLDDIEYPLEITGPNEHHYFGSNIYTVKQWTLIGWIRDDLTN